jgi:hypothetical protein
MGFNPLDALLKAVQYPQSVLSGVAKFGPGMHGQGGPGSGRASSLREGFRGGLSPSDVAMSRLSDDEKEQIANSAAARTVAQVAMTAQDLSLDPTLAVGSGAAGAKFLEGKKAGDLLKAAGTFGPLAEDAGKAAKLAQLARRSYQGALMSGGNPFTAIGAAALMGPAERAGSMLLSRLGTRAAEDLIGDGISKFDMSPEALMEVDSRYEAATKLLGLDGSEGAGFRRLSPEELGTPAHQMQIERWQPNTNNMVAPPSDNPIVSRAREFILGGKAGTTQEGLARDLFPKDPKAAENFLWQEASPVLGQLSREGVVGPRRGAIGDRAILGDPSRLDRTRVPFSDEGARFNEELLQGGMPVLPDQLASPPMLGAGPEYRQTAGPPIPMGRVPLGNSVELSQDLAAQLARIPGVTTAAGVGAMPAAPAELVSGPPVRAMGPAVPVQQQASKFLESLDPATQKKMTYLRARAVQGDKRAMLMLANLMEQIDEDPAERLIRLATSG